MDLGNFAHSYGQSCSSLWVNLPIVVGKLYSCTSSLIIVIFLARTLLYIYSTVVNGEVKITLHHVNYARYKRGAAYQIG